MLGVSLSPAGGFHPTSSVTSSCRTARHKRAKNGIRGDERHLWTAEQSETVQLTAPARAHESPAAQSAFPDARQAPSTCLADAVRLPPSRQRGIPKKRPAEGRSRASPSLMGEPRPP